MDWTLDSGISTLDLKSEFWTLDFEVSTESVAMALQFVPQDHAPVRPLFSNLRVGCGMMVKRSTSRASQSRIGNSAKAHQNHSSVCNILN
jgi:hypothetical protein